MLRQLHPAPGADARVSTQHRMRVVARGTNGQPRTYRLGPSSVQNTAYRRLALVILGLDVATLADELRSARGSAPGRSVSASIATRGLVPFAATTASARSA
jgi:hypothetical protein